MSNVINMLMKSAAITAAIMVGYKVIKSTLKENLRPHKRASAKVKNTSWRNIDKEYPTLHNPNWKKIGQVVDLFIYPVKSSEKAEFYDSFEFCDYGMCRWEYETYFWDGMFSVYNKTKRRFEDSRKYPLLRLLRAELTNTGEVTLSSINMSKRIKLDIHRHRNPSDLFVKETWNRTLQRFYSLNHVSTWLKDSMFVNGIKDDLILAQMLPLKLDSTEKIKNNWSYFLQGYEEMEKDDTGKFITLPRFVLMTSKTYNKLRRRHAYLTPNIVVDTDEKSIKPFEEKTWDWIKIGNHVILRKVKPIPSLNKNIQHYGIYCALWSGGNVRMHDEVYIYYSDIQHKCKKNIV